MKVFVYGTLMQGKKNAGLLETSEYMGRASIDHYALYQVNPEYPGIVRESANGVIGELYEVPEMVMPLLDKLEGVKEGLFARELVNIRCNSAWTSGFTYVWRGFVPKSQRIPIIHQPWKGGVK